MSADPIGIVGQLVADKYRIERFVAEGGFSVVYRAVHVIWNRPVAIKFFSALTQTSGDQRKDLELAFISLLALAGVGLVIGSVATGARRRSR